MSNTAVFPGTFDPITNGHVDLVKRACLLFNTVIVAIAENKNKQPLFNLERRVDLALRVLRDLPNAKVIGFSNLLAEFAQQQNAGVVLRGLRVVTDFEYEFQLANINRKLAPNVETVFLTPAENHAYISSTFVKEVAYHNGDVSGFVAPEIVDAFKTAEWPR